MAKPDCDDGWLPYAHELDAALAVADFTKGARIVLREVFAQIYGLAKRKHAELSPTEIGGRIGMARSHVMRGITELVGSGVLVRRPDGLYKFIKDYESWTYKGAPRLSPMEVVYCKHAPRTASSYIHTPRQNALPNEVTHQQSPVTNPGNEPPVLLPNEVTPVTSLGNGLLPNEVTDSSSPYRNARGIKTKNSPENPPTLSHASADEDEPTDRYQSGTPNVRDPDDLALVHEAMQILASHPNSGHLAERVGREHNTPDNVRLAGWKWVVAASKAFERSEGDGKPIDWLYLRGIVRNARRAEYDKIRTESASAPDPATPATANRPLTRKLTPAERRKAESEAMARAVASIPDDEEF